VFGIQQPPLPPGVVVRPSARARRVALRLDAAAGCVALVVPRRMPLRAAREFAWSRADWVARALASLPARVPFAHGAVLPLAGQDARIEATPGTGGSRVALDGGVLRVRLAAGARDPGPPVERFLRRHARAVLGPLLREKAAASGRAPPVLAVRDMRSRWGSCCARAGRVSLSWRLVLAPPAAADYVVAHEAAHLTHPDHSAAFWALCEALSEDYAVGKAWMRDHGGGLVRYGGPGGD
jgi:predicted metal-dependent hydrolase